jgi:hypothetical protein
MTSISTVSTFLPPQYHATPAQTAVNAANPTASIASVSASSSNGNNGTSTDKGAGGRSSGDPRLISKTADARLSSASAQSVIAAKAETVKANQVDDTARQPLAQAGKTAWSDTINSGDDKDRGSDPTQNTLPKAEGPLPIPTADILLKFRNSGA